MSKEKPKVALFLCKCGTNIAGTIDLDSVAKRFGNETEIVSHNLLCSPAGKKFMEDALKSSSPDIVVVAACSPKTHEKTFQGVASRAGINMAKVQMANIREQGAWVTPDKTEATQKAIELINGAIERSYLHTDLQQRSMECKTDVVIIGGGIAGIEAALLAANAGRKVTIIEKEISLGGNLIKMEEVAPNMECAPCLLAPRIAQVRDNKNITVIAHAEVTGVVGFFGNFTVKARRKARFVKTSCIGCESCFEVCPVSVKNDFHCGLGNRKAVYTLFAGSLPAMAVIDKENCKHFIDNSCDACVAACPFQSIDFEEKDDDVEVSAGAIILATGSGNASVESLASFGYTKLSNVITMPEFERIASSNGPYGGNIQCQDGRAVNSMAVLHCAGSLCETGIPYCSGICCITAMKSGELLRKKNPDAMVVNIHDRLVVPGPEATDFYHHQIKEGTTFIKSEYLQNIKVMQNGNMLEVSGKDFAPITVDMVVCATGCAPGSDTSHLSDLLNIEKSNAGFFKPDHLILHPSGTTIDGIYAVGSCVSPCDFPTAITRAQAAAGDVIAKLIPGRKIDLEVMTASIDESLCAGCKMCVAVCPYSAISYNAEKHVSVLNEAICRGCGTCAATCPGGAATAKHFTNNQIVAELEGIIHG